VRPQWALRQLQPAALVNDGIVAADDPLLLNAQDLREQPDRPAANALSAIRGGVANAHCGWVDLADEPIGGLDRADPGKPELLRQPILRAHGPSANRPGYARPRAAGARGRPG
jgi:hypothetical protein